MKTLQYSLAALTGVIIAKLILAQSFVTNDAKMTANGQPARIEVSGGVSGTWLTVERANKNDSEAKGFDPSYTYLLSDFKPLVKKLRNGKWEIQFTSEIAEDIP